MNFDPQHFADLQRSGLNDEMIKAMAVYSARPADIPKLIGWNPEEVKSALVFPYFGPDGKSNGFSRIKSFPAYLDKNGHKVKYLQEKGSSPHLYILPPLQNTLNDTTQQLDIVEGEKKIG